MAVYRDDVVNKLIEVARLKCGLEDAPLTKKVADEKKIEFAFYNNGMTVTFKISNSDVIDVFYYNIPNDVRKKFSRVTFKENFNIVALDDNKIRTIDEILDKTVEVILDGMIDFGDDDNGETDEDEDKE